MRKYADVVLSQTATGLAQPVVGASVQVLGHVSQTNATIFSDDGVTTTGNPLATDAQGRYQFYVANGRYDIKITAVGFTPFTLTDIDIHDETDITVPGETPLPGNLIFTGTNSHSGTEIFTGQFSATAATNINNILYISQFAGADLGAKMNAAVTNCTVTLALAACKYIVDVAGTISTSPNFPVGSTVEFAPLTYTLAATFPINHNNTQFYFNGARFNYNQDTGNAAFLVGKNATGTVNTQNGATGGCSANCVTFATGTNFANIDAGDKIIIANVGFNVASVQSSTVLTVTSAPGTQTGAAYAAQLNPTSSAFTSVTARDLTVGYIGAGTNANNTAFLVQNVTTGHFENFYINGYSNGYGLRCQGSVSNVFIDIRQVGNKNAFVFDQFIGGGSTIPSNENLVIHPLVYASPAGGNPILITNGSTENILQYGDFEGNAATVMGTINLNAQAQILWSDHERNGDGTTSSADWSVSSKSNIFFGNTFTSAGANTPATGIIVNAGGNATRIDNNRWGVGAPYTNTWTFASGVPGTVINNINAFIAGQIGGIGHVDPTVGFVTNELGGFGASAQAGAAIGDPPSIQNTNCLRGAVAANNNTYCLIGPSSTNGVSLDSGGTGTTTGGALTVGTNATSDVALGTIHLGGSRVLLLSVVAPTILTHFNTSGDSITANNGTASFVITTGTGTGTSTGALTFPTAATGWTCWLTNQTRAALIQQTGSTTTSATFTNFGTTFAATNWTNGDVLRGGCTAN